MRILIIFAVLTVMTMALASEETWKHLWKLSLYSLLFTFVISLASGKRWGWLFPANLVAMLLLGYLGIVRY